MSRQSARFIALVAAVLALLTVGVTVAHAAAPTDDEKRRAGALYAEGQTLFEQELYAAAIEKFKAAHAIIPHEVNLYNIARAYEKLGAAKECISWYDQYVDFYKKKHGSDPDDIVDVRASVQKCRFLLKPEVQVGSEPFGAKVYIDDREKLLGQTPYTTTLDPGTYTFYLDLNGYAPFKQQVEVRAGEPVKLFFKLEKLQRVGTVHLTSNVRGASIFIDGRNIGLTPYKDAITLDEGKHQFTVQKDDYNPFSEELDVVVNEEHTVASEIYLRDPPMTWKGYVGYTALILGAGGVGFGVFSKTQADKYFKGTDDFNTWETWQNVGYGAGGGLMGVGILLLVLDALDTDIVKSGDAIDEARTAPSVMPILGASPDGGLLGADVRF
ncbi:MAG: PEGA domain-containing protein [Myxococcales bacterium]|nr:PEGA domain-containing protein [Myxococcales bacterium]MCB9734651.1 PEGA domain-containing protein [Deltaproteobacteria bacterium]